MAVKGDHGRPREAGEAAATSEASRRHGSPDCEGLGEPCVVRKGSANAGHDCVLQQDAKKDHPGHLQEPREVGGLEGRPHPDHFWGKGIRNQRERKSQRSPRG